MLQMTSFVTTDELPDVLGLSKQQVRMLALNDPGFPKAVCTPAGWIRSRFELEKYRQSFDESWNLLELLESH